MNKGKKILWGVLVGAGTAATSLTLGELGFLNRWEFATWSWRVKFFARPGPQTEKIRLILLDQQSLDWGKEESGLSWPWPREVYTPIIDFCRRSGAKAVAFDVLYTEPSVYGVNDDKALGAAIKNSPPFAGAMALTRSEAGIDSWPAEITKPELSISGLRPWLDASRKRDRLVYPRATFPIPEVTINANLLGNVIDDPDPDSVFRRATLFDVFNGRVVPSLGLAAYLVSNERFSSRENSLCANTFSLGPVGDPDSITIPLGPEGRTILRFRGQTSVYQPVSAAAVIQSELRLLAGEKPPLDPETFQNCYVFFGFSAPGLLDLRSTPINPVAPGVMIHATVLDNILGGDFLRDAPAGAALTVGLLIAVGAALAVIFCKKAWQSLLVFLLFLPLPWLLGFAAYPTGRWWPIISTEGAAVTALVGALVVNYATEGRQKAFIKNAFKYYLSSAVIEKLIADPSQLTLGGERRELSIFFSDLQGFSSLSERLNPVELTALLNDYLSDMTDIILEEGGTLDKYEGDAIIAFWNAPLTQGNHAVLAVRAALRCQRKLAQRRPEFKERAGTELHMRIGINTGEVVVGNMGSRERFDYTVLGDAANLASRLEGANKAFGTYFMVSESTWQQTVGSFAGRELGQIRVVGRTTPVRVFEPLALAGEELTGAPEEFEKGVGLCYGGKWEEARAVFERYPGDPVSRIYAGRCRRLIENPAETWDGIWNLTEK